MQTECPQLNSSGEQVNVSETKRIHKNSITYSTCLNKLSLGKILREKWNTLPPADDLHAFEFIQES